MPRALALAVALKHIVAECEEMQVHRQFTTTCSKRETSSSFSFKEDSLDDLCGFETPFSSRIGAKGPFCGSGGNITGTTCEVSSGAAAAGFARGKDWLGLKSYAEVRAPS